jgi:predicted permease
MEKIMTLALIILTKLIPLYLLIALGYIAGRFLAVKRESIAPLLIYIISPVVVFNAILSTELTTKILMLPFLFWAIACGVCVVALKTGERFLGNGPLKNILAFACGSGNTGYFGLPVAIFLFGESSAGLAIIAGFGMVLFENTLGFFTTARGHHTAKESLFRVLKLPALYAFILGIALNFSGVRLQKPWSDLALNFRGAYAVIGMMMVGLGVATLKNFKFNFKFIGLSLVFKFFLWPALVFGIIFLDRTVMHFFSPEIHQIMVLMSIVPLPANAVAVATALNTEPEMAGVAVLASTAFGLIYIPLVVSALT